MLLPLQTTHVTQRPHMSRSRQNLTKHWGPEMLLPLQTTPPHKDHTCHVYVKIWQNTEALKCCCHYRPHMSRSRGYKGLQGWPSAWDSGWWQFAGETKSTSVEICLNLTQTWGVCMSFDSGPVYITETWQDTQTMECCCPTTTTYIIFISQIRTLRFTSTAS